MKKTQYYITHISSCRVESKVRGSGRAYRPVPVPYTWIGVSSAHPVKLPRKNTETSLGLFRPTRAQAIRAVKEILNITDGEWDEMLLHYKTQLAALRGRSKKVKRLRSTRGKKISRLPVLHRSSTRVRVDGIILHIHGYGKDKKHLNKAVSTAKRKIKR